MEVEIDRKKFRGLVQEYLKDLCKTDIRVCTGSFSKTFIESAIGKEDAEKFIGEIIERKEFGPISYIGVSKTYHEEQKYLNMGY